MVLKLMFIWGIALIRDLIDESKQDVIVSKRDELICVRIISGWIDEMKRGKEFKECKG